MCCTTAVLSTVSYLTLYIYIYIYFSFNFLLYHMLIHGNPGYLDAPHHKNSCSDKKEGRHRSHHEDTATATTAAVEEGRYFHATMTAPHNDTINRYRSTRSSPSHSDYYNGSGCEDNDDACKTRTHRETAPQKQALVWMTMNANTFGFHNY